MKKIVIATAAALISGIASAPSWADCTNFGGEHPPFCETGTFVVDSVNPDRCLKGHMSDSGNKYALQYSATPGVVIGGAIVAELLFHGGDVSVVTKGLQTTCDDGGYYQIVAVRRGGF